MHEFLPKNEELDDPEILEEITNYCSVSEETLALKNFKITRNEPDVGESRLSLRDFPPGNYRYDDARPRTRVL